jgi:DNA-binding HxlR family transcriptional regulator
MQLFGGKWKSRIICVLADMQIIRYSDLRDEMINITDAVLSAALKELTKDGLIERIYHDEIPPRVEYSLTDKGRSVVPILQTICRWSGHFFQDTPSDLPLKHCQKCNYNPSVGKK